MSTATIHQLPVLTQSATPPVLTSLTSFAVSITDMKQQVNLIQHIMKEVMQEGVHFGVIPGCGDKPALLKPGAEKLMLTFRLSNDIEMDVIDMGNWHREYRVKVTIYSITGQRLGTGVGSCSTMEGKYRFRTGPTEITNQEVPKTYWTIRKEDPIKAQELIGGKGFATKKGPDNRWMIAVQGEKVEYENPADYYNTCLKMSKKRGLVDAVLTSTAASDIFTQDIDEDPELHGYRQNVQPKNNCSESDIAEGEYTSVTQSDPTLDLKQIEDIKKMMAETSTDESTFLTHLGFETLAHIPVKKLTEVIGKLETKRQSLSKKTASTTTQTETSAATQQETQTSATSPTTTDKLKRTISDTISMLAIKNIEMNLSPDGSIIYAKSFNEKDFLKQSGFRWNSDAKCWTWSEAH